MLQLNHRTVIIVFGLIYIFLIQFADASSFVISNDKTLIGDLKTYRAKENESLIEIARKFGLGYNEIVDANPELDPFVAGNDAAVKIPSLWILPDTDNHKDIVINLSEMRLYHFQKRKGQIIVNTFPVGIGDEGNDTPIGNFKIIEKIKRPSWYVPESIRKEKPQLPNVVPPGPNNPLGSHALRLSLNSYLIHGTNRPWAVGRKVTHGCIRLYPEDIPRLFSLVSVGTTVTIVRQPVKVAEKDKTVYIEVHKDDSKKDMNYINEAVRILSKKRLINRVNTEKLYIAVKDKNGIPIKISD